MAPVGSRTTGYDRAVRVAGAAGPPGRGAAAGVGPLDRPPAAGSSTSARTSTAGSACAGLGPAGTEITLTYGEWLDDDGRRHPGPRRLRRLDRGRPVRDVPGRHGHLGRRGRRRLRAPPQHQGLPVRPGRGLRRAADRRRRHRRRRPHRLRPPRRVRMLATTASNAIHRIAEWSFRDNACDIPTDCPTRERAGWTGDWQIYVETAAFLYDVGGFSREVAARPRGRPAARRQGDEPRPRVASGRRPPARVLARTRGLVGLGRRGGARAVGRVPDDRRPRRSSPTSGRRCQAWVDFAAQAAAGGRHPSRVERSADPLPHERYLWDTRLALRRVAGGAAST